MFKSFFQRVEGRKAILLPVAQASTNDNIGLSIAVNKPAIILIPDVVSWRVLINDFIVQIVTNKETCIVDTTEGNHFIENIRMLQEEINGMISTHGAACRHHRVKPARLMFDKWNRFFNDITLIGTVHFCSVVWVLPVRQPALAINAAESEKLDLTSLNKTCAGLNHTEVSIFIMATA